MLFDLNQMIPANHVLLPDKQKNIRSVISSSNIFAQDAGLGVQSIPSINEESIILESGHQPNYFPYSGVWKKVYLLDQFCRMLEETGLQGIGLFGFLDQNMATSTYLFKNQIPALNRNGTQKIGVPINKADKWKRFSEIEKPSSELWDTEIKKIESVYAGIPLDKSELFEIISSSYNRAVTYSDLNAYIFSRISREIFGLDVFFFRYSDLKNDVIFSDGCRKLLSNLDKYNIIYNETIQKENLRQRTVNRSEVPFWYHCSCGGKTTLLIDSSGVCKGTCPVCKENYELDLNSDFHRLEIYLPDMSFSSVSRNVIFFEALGTHIFISGTGGGLEYGKISNEISIDMGFNTPITCSWSSRDYYLGKVHNEAIKELMSTFPLEKVGILDSTLSEYVSSCQQKREAETREMNNFGQKKGLRINMGRVTGSTQACMISRVFSSVPSFLDLCMNIETKKILSGWQESLNHAILMENGSFYILKGDVIYDDGSCGYIHDEIPLVFKNISKIGGANK